MSEDRNDRSGYDPQRDDGLMSSDEEQRLREEVRARLLSEMQHERGFSDKSASDEAALLRMERQRIMREEEDAFYAERGLRRYRNHRGEYEWLTEEEIADRKGRRRAARPGSQRGFFSKRSMGDVISGIVLLGAVAISLLIVMRSVKTSDLPYAIEILSEPPGAAVFVNGKAANLSTNCLVHVSNPGTVMVSLYLPGYQWAERPVLVDPEPDEPPVASLFRLQAIPSDSTPPPPPSQ